MSEQVLTPERLAELRRIAEATTFLLRHGAVVDMSRYHQEFDPPTALAMVAEIERLRRERETLAAAVRAWDDYAKTISEDGPLSFDAIEASERAEQRHREALALLEGGGGA